MNVGEIYKRWFSALRPVYGEREAKAIIREAFEHYLGLSPVDTIVRNDFRPGAETLGILDNALARLMDGEPVQYVTGESWFNGLKLKVTPDVLIPRKETSQLVDIIVNSWKGRNDLRIVDLCSGSGAIALALCRGIAFAEITGVEISSGALKVAAENSRILNCKINWLEADILAPGFRLDGEYDIVVSNPPYILRSERHLVDNNVLDFEPHQALFVPDDRPLLFYEAIADWSRNHLKTDGKIYFEINPGFADATATLLHRHGFADVTVEKDFAGKNRFIVACR